MMLSRRVLLLADVGAVSLLYTLWSARPLWSDIALLLVLCVAVAITWKGTFPPRQLSLPALAFLGAFVVSALFAADPLTAWRSVLGVAAYGLVFVLIGNLLSHGLTRAELYRALVLAAQVLTIALAASWLAEGGTLGDRRLRFETTNSAALAVLLLWPALLVGEARWLVAGESALMLTLSASRTGLLGLAASAAAAVWRWPALRRLRLPLMGMGAVVGGGLLRRGDLLALNARGDLWALALRMWAAAPLFGKGPNAFKSWWLAVDNSPFFYGHAHNLLLNLAAETGALGVAAGIWLGAALLWVLVKRGRSPWAVAALCATLGLLAHSVGDVPTTAPYITVTWLALVRLGLTERDAG